MVRPTISRRPAPAFLPFLPLLALLAAAGTARAQCPEPFAWNGDEPADFTHYVDEDGDGACDRDAGGALVVPLRANGTHPNALYPTCDVDGDGAIDPAADQIAHGHWEYTSLHRADDLPETEEKDYLTATQAMEKDFENRDPNGTATRESVEQTMRFGLNEPKRFDRFLRPGANPEGRYWQVDEWIGPGGSPGHVPGLTWTERFFVCGSEDSLLAPCATVDGKPAVGGYWSTHAEDPFAYQDDCGDPLVADPEPPAAPRHPRCGILFAECAGP